MLVRAFLLGFFIGAITPSDAFGLYKTKNPATGQDFN
jgi:hypothetical protein